ncbi:uncharacterized protein [Battus philenor]|uniref:uncharacterized protein n=1 Tax=Battus philenor TaxID=42288 RepID=UPI0035CEE2FD
MAFAMDLESGKEDLRKFFDIDLKNVKVMMEIWKNNVLYNKFFNKACDDESPIYGLNVTNLEQAMNLMSTIQVTPHNHHPAPPQDPWTNFMYGYNFTDIEAEFELYKA